MTKSDKNLKQTLSRTGMLCCLVIGFHLACIQYAYLFLLEAYHSSRSVTYFICLFFWLLGFLLGLNFNRTGWLISLIILGWLGYETVYWMQSLFPYRDFLYPLIACAISISGIQAGYFFNSLSENQSNAKVLESENNGFVLGTFFCMMFVLYAGWYFLAAVPTLLTVMAVVSAHILEKSKREGL